MIHNYLLSRIKSNDEEAFKLVFNSFYKELVIYANKYVFDNSLCEDLVQEVFIKFWKKKEAIQVHQNLKSYLYSMVRNNCLNYLKTIKITDSENYIDSYNVAFDEMVDVETNEVEKKYQSIMKIIEQMPNCMQEVFRLKYINNYQYKEIAEELNISVNSVKTQLKRAKLKIEKNITTVFFVITYFLI